METRIPYDVYGSHLRSCVWHLLSSELVVHDHLCEVEGGLFVPNKLRKTPAWSKTDCKQSKPLGKLIDISTPNGSQVKHRFMAAFADDIANEYKECTLWIREPGYVKGRPAGRAHVRPNVKI